MRTGDAWLEPAVAPCLLRYTLPGLVERHVHQQLAALAVLTAVYRAETFRQSQSDLLQSCSTFVEAHASGWTSFSSPLSGARRHVYELYDGLGTSPFKAELHAAIAS
jgi:hypothetical protein